jgi:hypothetical protein
LSHSWPCRGRRGRSRARWRLGRGRSRSPRRGGGRCSLLRPGRSGGLR